MFIENIKDLCKILSRTGQNNYFGLFSINILCLKAHHFTMFS